MLSAATGALTGLVDVVTSYHACLNLGFIAIALMLGFFAEKYIRPALIKKLLFDETSELDEYHDEKKRIINSFGFNSSWSGWIAAVVVLKCKIADHGKFFP